MPSPSSPGFIGLVSPGVVGVVVPGVPGALVSLLAKAGKAAIAPRIPLSSSADNFLFMVNLYFPVSDRVTESLSAAEVRQKLFQRQLVQIHACSSNADQAQVVVQVQHVSLGILGMIERTVGKVRL